MTSGFPLVGEPLAVDLANTLVAESDALTDRLADESTLRVWLELHQDQLPTGALVGPPPLEKVHALREAVRELLHAHLAARPPAEAALEAVNHLLGDAPIPELTWFDGQYHQRSRPGSSPGAAVLTTVARSAMETLTGENADRLRLCDGRNCVLIFVAGHPHRQYCSPRLCGTRERVARHRERARSRG